MRLYPTLSLDRNQPSPASDRLVIRFFTRTLEPAGVAVGMEVSVGGTVRVGAGVSAGNDVVAAFWQALQPRMKSKVIRRIFFISINLSILLPRN